MQKASTYSGLFTARRLLSRMLCPRAGHILAVLSGSSCQNQCPTTTVSVIVFSIRQAPPLTVQTRIVFCTFEGFKPMCRFAVPKGQYKVSSGLPRASTWSWLRVAPGAQEGALSAQTQCSKAAGKTFVR